MWRERKNNCLDVFDQIIDSSSKKEKQVYEEYGLETAEEANQPTLKEFGITIKELIYVTNFTMFSLRKMRKYIDAFKWVR